MTSPERAHPGELIHFDIKKLARIVRTGHRITGDRQHDHTPGAGWEFLHIAIDDHSRLAFAQLLPDETALSAIAFLHAALAFFARHGIQAQRIYSDNGACYRSHTMRAASPVLGLKQRFNQALHSQDQWQGRALHPDLAPRVGLRPLLLPLRPTRLTPPALPPPLQLASSSPFPQTPLSHFSPPPSTEQPLEPPHLASA